MHSESLKSSEQLSAKGAVAPRVSLADMEGKIAHKHFVNAGNAVGEGMFESSLGLMTLCFLVMQNGFVVVGKSAPASPENFDESKGRQFAYEDAIKQLWPLEGYALRDRLSAT